MSRDLDGVAVLGAGLSGSLVALELAELGHHVDLFDQAAEPISSASYNNEGKLHLGFVYAKDASARTARTMIDGALQFTPLLSRWIPLKDIENAASSPFIYALHRDSMVDRDALMAHFNAVDKLIKEREGSSKAGYIRTIGDRSWRPATQAQHETVFDPKWISCSFHTDERAVDTEVIARAIRASLRQAPRLVLRLGNEVIGVRPVARGYEVDWRDAAGALRRVRYGRVVNALWQNRAAIDAGVGLATDRPLLHRYKLGFAAEISIAPAGLESVTFVLGSFGDSVRFRNRIYLSWYPAGLLNQELALKPGFQPPANSILRKNGVLESTIDALAQLMPQSRACLLDRSLEWRPLGGFISAWGKSGIEDPGSELHQRYRVGVRSQGNYHSIDTGKYTLAPMFARQICRRLVE